MSRLPRLDLQNPVAVVGAHGKAQGTFWGAIAMQRHVSRTVVVASRETLVPDGAANGLGAVSLIDGVLDPTGVVWSMAPDGWTGNDDQWPAHVQWGADQFVEIVRHLGGGRFVAAAVMCRAQLERWTINVAYAHGRLPADGEDNQLWITRVWEAYPHIGVDMGQEWGYLSEVIHGRGIPLPALRLNRTSAQASGTDTGVPSEWADLTERIVAIAFHVLWQVRGCAAEIATSAGKPEWARLLQQDVPVAVTGMDANGKVFVSVMDFAFVESSLATEIRAAAVEYRRLIERTVVNDQLFLLNKGHLAAMAMMERRSRAMDRFSMGARREEAELGDEYDRGNLHSRLFRYIAISEAAELVSMWAGEVAEEEALLVAAQGLRDAMHFWLEDTDLSLPCMRVILEQTCIARTWRTKPPKAAQLRDSGRRATPHRWLEASGWRRAAVLGRALGEFSHVTLRARTRGARKLLIELQGTDMDTGLHTARGHALDSTAYLLAQEVVARLEVRDADLAAGFRSEVTLLEEADHRKETEDLLERALALKKFDFGDVDISLRFSDDDDD